MDRRTFLRTGAGLLGATLASRTPAFAGADAGGAPLLASCVRLDDGAYAVAVVDAAGDVRAVHPLPDRGHGVAVDAGRGRCVAFARRPGTFAVVFDLGGRTPPSVIAAAAGRHFFGHGVFDAAGARLYATENEVATGEGRIGVYDAEAGFARIGELPTGGVGPHELVWCADGRTLAVANGGLDTDPTFGRRNLDVAGMRSSLTLVEAASGRIVAEAGAGAGLAMLSIRHLAAGRDGALWFGCQNEGDPAALPPLVGRMDAHGAVRMVELPVGARAVPRNYVGSVAVSADGALVAVSAPRGGAILGFDGSTGAFLGVRDLVDGCGLAPSGAGVLASAGTGRLAALAVEGGVLTERAAGRARLAFDNHLAPVA